MQIFRSPVLMSMYLYWKSDKRWRWPKKTKRGERTASVQPITEPENQPELPIGQEAVKPHTLEIKHCNVLIPVLDFVMIASTKTKNKF